MCRRQTRGSGDWSGTVVLRGYNVTYNGQNDQYGDQYVSFQIHVNYYCNQPEC